MNTSTRQPFRPLQFASFSTVAVAALLLSGCGQNASLDAPAAPSEVADPTVQTAAENSRSLPAGQVLFTASGSLPAGTFASNARAFIQPDLRVVVANANGSGGIVVSRYLPTGRLDPSFANQGSVFFDALPDSYDNPFDVTVDAEGRILVVGAAGVGFVARLKPSGQLDSSFAQGGVFARAVVPTAGYVFDPVTAAAQRVRISGKKILVQGEVSSQGINGQPFVWRLTNTGQLDASFAGDGEVVLDPTGGPTRTVGFDVHTSGEAFLGGSGFGATPGQFLFVAKLTNAGAPDARFGTSGVSSVPLSSDVNLSTIGGGALALQENGKLVLLTSGQQGYGLYRFSRTGVLERRAVLIGAQENRDFNRLLFQPDGKIVVAGDKNQAPFLARLSNDFVPDTSFGAGGEWRNDFGYAIASLKDVRLFGNAFALAVGGERFNPPASDFVFSLVSR